MSLSVYVVTKHPKGAEAVVENVSISIGIAMSYIETNYKGAYFVDHYGQPCEVARYAFGSDIYFTVSYHAVQE